MLNLTSLASITKKAILPLVIVLIVSFFVFLIFLRLTSQKGLPDAPALPSEKIEKPTFTGTTFRTGRFNTDRLNLPQNFPETLAVYNIDQKANLLTNADFLASSLGFAQPPDEVDDAIVGKKLAYSNENTYLSIYQSGFSYTDFSKSLPETGQFKNTEELRDEAISFISSLGISPSVSDEYQISYYQSLGEFEKLTNSPQQANRIDISLDYEISGTKVIGQNIIVKAKFNRQNELREIVYNQLMSGEEIGSYPVISPEEALKSLVTDKGNLIDIITPNAYSPPPKQFKLVNLNKAYLAYYQPKDGLTLQPVWVFEGKSQVNDREVLLTYAIPAIKSEFFINP